MFVTVLDRYRNLKSIRKELILSVTEFSNTGLSERSAAFNKDIKTEIIIRIGSIHKQYHKDGDVHFPMETTTIFSQTSHKEVMQQLKEEYEQL